MARQKGRGGFVGTVLGLVLGFGGIVGWGVGLTLWMLLANDTRPRVVDPPHGVTIVRHDPVVSDPTDPASDDGELHDARTPQEGYSFVEQYWAHDDDEHLEAYDLDVRSSFSVRYPQLEGDLEHLDVINELLEATALDTVRTYYDDPSKETVERVRTLVEDDDFFVPEGVDAYLASEVTYAVSYNSADLLSVCFSDTFYVGSEAAGFVRLRTVNVDLRTGEAYQLEDVLRVDEELAQRFVDNLVACSGTDSDGDGYISDDECLSVKLRGREAFEQGILGRGDLADRLEECFFVDGNGRVNLGVNYWVSGDDGFVRGWWDVTLTREQEERLRLDSPFWELLAAGE